MKTKSVTKTLLSTLIVAATGVASAAAVVKPADYYRPIKMTVSDGAKECLPYAVGYVTIKKLGFAEHMRVVVKNLRPKTEFDFFVIQQPNFPFGMSWYQGDIETDEWGNGYADFIGRFNEETFVIGVGAAPAPVIHKDGKFPDANSNPATGPIHTFHLGLWFNSPDDARDAGCSDLETPFNGEHNAGIQVLNTAKFKKFGPLAYLNDYNWK